MNVQDAQLWAKRAKPVYFQDVKDDPPRRRRPNADEKRALKAASVQTFVQRYQRTSRRDGDPNDRRYDKDTERAVAQMKPEEFDRLLRDDED